MKRALSFWSVVVLTLCGVIAFAQDQASAPVIDNVRVGIDGKGTTRVVVDLVGAPTFDVLPIGSGDARRLQVRINNASVKAGRTITPKPLGAVSDVRVAGGVVEVDLTGAYLPKSTFVLKPSSTNAYHRLVVDIAQVSTVTFVDAAETAAEAEAVRLAIADAEAARVREAAEASSKAEADAAARADRKAGQASAQQPAAETQAETELADVSPVTPLPTLKPRTQAGGRALVVIDPGHGGRDPGAIGVSTQLREKDITLGSAKMLGVVLEARGYDVLLTRTDDSFVSLPNRIRFARDREADLFLSLHADANPEPLARGATVYTLDEGRGEKMAAEASASGNFRVFRFDPSQADGDVSTILYDLARTDTMNQSARLAIHVVDEMRGRVPMVNNTHRKASLQVLLSPDVPAILVEMAFLSNRKDEQNLASLRWRRRTMTAVADGIDAYFEDVGYPSRAKRAAAGLAPPVSR